MMSSRRHRRRHSLSDDSKEANGNHADPGTEPEPEELDWDSYSTTLEHRLAAVGNSCWFLTVDCRVYVLYLLSNQTTGRTDLHLASLINDGFLLVRCRSKLRDKTKGL